MTYYTYYFKEEDKPFHAYYELDDEVILLKSDIRNRQKSDKYKLGHRRWNLFPSRSEF